MAVRFIETHELLHLADHLAGRESGPGAPRTIYLRRSISTAYYALFHKLGQHASLRLVGDGPWTPKHAALTRWITHTELAVLSNAANGLGNKALVAMLDPVDARLANISQNFIDLQDARHGADYDDLFAVSKSFALSYVDAARSAAEAADELYESREPSYMRFLGLSFGGVKVAKSR